MRAPGVRSTKGCRQSDKSLARGQSASAGLRPAISRRSIIPNPRKTCRDTDLPHSFGRGPGRGRGGCVRGIAPGRGYLSLSRADASYAPRAQPVSRTREPGEDDGACCAARSGSGGLIAGPRAVSVGRSFGMRGRLRREGPGQSRLAASRHRSVDGDKRRQKAGLAQRANSICQGHQNWVSRS